MSGLSFRTILLALVLAYAGNTCAQADIDSIYGFELKVDLKATPVKDQYKSETCWAYAATSYVESELIRLGKGEFDLSEKFFINRDYYLQAIDYVRWNGKKDFSSGAEAFNVFNRIGDCGIMLEADYGCEFPEYWELDKNISTYINSIVSSSNKPLTTAWAAGIDAILNNHLGTLPAKFDYNGQTYTPIEFRDFLGFNPSDYINFSSFSHHPLYKDFILESPDNWDYCHYYNVTIDELTELMFGSLEKGFTVLWSGDFSEDYIDDYLLVVPEPDTAQTDLTGTDRERLNQSDNDDYNETDDNDSITKELAITPEIRQIAFDNYETTDDHCMHITGYLTDRNGSRYLKVKNSWGEETSRNGFIYMSETFFRYKTLNITVHKDAVPTDLKNKLNL